LDGNVTVAASALVVVIALVGTIAIIAVVRSQRSKGSSHLPQRESEISIDTRDAETGIALSEGPIRRRSSFNSFEFVNDPSWRKHLDSWMGRTSVDDIDVTETTTNAELLADVLCSVGLEAYEAELASIGVTNITDLEKVVAGDDSSLISIGIRRLQISKLRRALEEGGSGSQRELRRVNSLESRHGSSSDFEEPEYISRAFSFRSVEVSQLVADHGRRMSGSQPRASPSSPIPVTPVDGIEGNSSETVEPELMDLLKSAGLEAYAQKFTNFGLLTVDGVTQTLSNDESQFKAIGFRKVQLARLRQALGKARPRELTQSVPDTAPPLEGCSENQRASEPPEVNFEKSKDKDRGKGIKL